MSEVCNPTKSEKYQYISDTYKAAHGFRPRFDCNDMSHAEWAREQKRNNKWEAKVWFHRLMVEEARRSPDGVVYENEEWNNGYAMDSYYSQWDGVVGPELYYFNKSFTNNMVI